MRVEIVSQFLLLVVSCWLLEKSKSLNTPCASHVPSNTFRGELRRRNQRFRLEEENIVGWESPLNVLEEWQRS
jgi:hypothetical protein